MTKTITKAMAATAAIGLSALVMTGCGSKSNSGDSQPSAIASADPTAASPSGTASKSTGKSTGKPAASGSKATVLQMTASIRSAIRDAYFMTQKGAHPKEKQANIVGPTETHYGKIGGVYYAIGEISFKDDPVSTQDGPHVWKSPNGTDWSYEGDTGGEICGKVPRALVKAWGKPCI